MKKLFSLCVAYFAALVTLTNAATITVTTVNNVSPGGNKSLAQAILEAQAGDTIAFNIPGAGPHYIIPPPGGLPLITKDRVTIDGYSQPGASPNSNPINKPNNAVIKIVLDASAPANGFNLDPSLYRVMAYEQFGTTVTSSPPIDNSSMASERSGYGTIEIAILGIYRATNVNVRGLAFLAGYDPSLIPPEEQPDGDPYSPYMIAVAHDYGLDATVKPRLEYNEGSSRNCHINGCWFGIDPANPDAAHYHPGSSAIAFFRHRDISGGPRPELPNESLICGVAPGSSNPRAEFNVIGYMELALAGEPVRTRFSGNFLGLFPDGVTGTGIDPANFSSGFELGRYDDTQPIIIGTDGDGVNDADEGNLYGPLEDGGIVMAFYNTGNKLYKISGNRIGLGAGGVRLTNSCTVVDEIRFDQQTHAQFGSDFDGVSDAWEANVVFNNYPFNPGIGTPPHMFGFNLGSVGAAAYFSMRGNVLVNNLNPPYSPTEPDYLAYYSPFMNPLNIQPVLDSASSVSHLIGSCGTAAGATYTNIIIDVYLADLEGVANGKLLLDPLLPDGFLQGRTYLGSFVDNGPGDSDAGAGDFNLDVSALGIAAGSRVTVTATYSQDPAGTHNGRAHTSPFSAPVAVSSGMGAVITVTTADNVNPGLSKSFAQAILEANNGDTIVFDIPGAGPHYVIPPAGGLPLIIKDNVTVNGYSQPGSSPNTNPIDEPNNAVIQIVLDASAPAGGFNLDPSLYRVMAYEQFGTTVTSSPPIDNSAMASERSGYGTIEIAILGIYRATNVNVTGLAFLAGYDPSLIPPEEQPDGDPYSPYMIAVAHDYGLDTSVKDRLAYNEGSSRNCHINGCWFGIDPAHPDADHYHPGSAAIAFFRHRDVSGGPRPELPNESLICGVAPGTMNPRAQFNVIGYMELALAGEPIRTRFSGNFLGLFPDGVTGTGIDPANFSSGFELGRYNDTEPIIIGTDGDGVNDADEGNMYGPLEDGGIVMAFYNTGVKPYRIAGNRIGLGAGGVRLTNSCTVVDEIRFDQGSRAQFGSDFDGVSDAWEANVVYNNYPFNAGIGTPPHMFGFNLGSVPATASFSLRGNVLVNNLNPPYSPTEPDFMNYYAPFMDAANVAPVVSPASSGSQLIGTCATATVGSIYTNILIDVYLVDPEGLANGALLLDPLLPNGFVQGKTYVGSFVDNGPGDGNPAASAFSFSMSGLGLSSGDDITITASYSADPSGTHNARTHTSLFSAPVELAAGIVITSIVDNGANVTLTWMGGGPMYSIEGRATLTGATSIVASGIATTTATVAKSGNIQFYRVQSP